jgi:RNA polymerase sigma-70 factor (ECF subfamily)
MNTATGPHEGLLHRARRGDRGALGQLLDSHAAYLTLLARVQIGQRLRGKVDPGDLVQETFLAAHAAFDRFRGASEAEFLAWLRQIFAKQLANLLRRYLGTKGRNVRLERPLKPGPDQSSQTSDEVLVAVQSSPSQRAARREQAVLLAEALGRLPEDYREVLVLRDLEELPFTEVARRMGRSVDAVEKLWLRALARLRHTMGGAHEAGK